MHPQHNSVCEPTSRDANRGMMGFIFHFPFEFRIFCKSALNASVVGPEVWAPALNLPPII